MDELRQREWFALFDGGVASCDVHLCKPEPEIYTTLMQQCNLAYDESIFVDDNKINAQAAYNLGITGILYKNPKSFQRALGACGIQLGIKFQPKKKENRPAEAFPGRAVFSSWRRSGFLCG